MKTKKQISFNTCLLFCIIEMTNKTLPPTSVLQDCGVSAFLETFVLNQSLGIFRNFSAKIPQPRKALGR